MTDREKGIINAIELELPNAKLLLCWNHLRQDIRRWLWLHKAKQQDTSVYMADIKVLLNCESLENFEDEYKSMSTKWSSAFKEYFDERVKSDISNHAGRWILTQFGSYIPHSGITNNMSESMNVILKRLLEWKEVQCDSAVLSFRFLQVYYHNELLRGLCGTGSFRLKPEFLRCQQSLEDIEFPKEVCAPQDIVNKLKNVNNSNLSSLSSEEMIMKNNLVSSEANPAKEHAQTFTEHPPSQAALAREVINDHRIVQVPEMKTFIIKSSNNDAKYCVTLFPKEKCSCPSVTICYHILAARNAIGLEKDQPKKKL